MSENISNIEKLESSLETLKNNNSVIYFLTYDTKNSPKASVKYIYDVALTLNQAGLKAKILVEDKSYVGVSNWLGDRYSSLEIVTIKEDKIQIRIEDILVVPELFSNVLEQLSNIKCVKVMLVQQKDYIFESLPIGSKWSNFGFEHAITTTQKTKEYITELFPETSVYVIPPIIGDNFKPSDKPKKPYIAISCRDRVINRRVISEFYLKFPQLRWITFKDMVQLTYDEFSDALNECMVALWVDDESTFGTYPLECMKSNVPVVGKIPNIEPDWLSENGMWTYDMNKLVHILGTYVMAWIEGVELTDAVKAKIKQTLLPYDEDVTKNNIITIFNSLRNNRINKIQLALEKLKQ